ncbi:MAG: sensor histidine kinase [Candidatus Abyssobacteria bacterium SURF_5]|uniref:Sensor histidine kinase n=1 Tax=Abyssobacteria bacterium (strain SURF_5) TaxID=2093360 RepID=A0A3A4N6U5_ABYX5|nr:MAG: sensor histidine kinase [Candidatus Abyssubacteria bacterium SURF_5]
MTEKEIRILWEKELAFFGVVTASLSHEINNVVAIVGELTGLLDDLLSASEQGRPLNSEKLKGLSSRLSKQVDKGKIIIKRLNRFAHSVDDPVKQVNLGELLFLISAIAERFAFLKGICIKTEFDSADSVTVETDPFALQQAVFTCIQLALSTAGSNAVINIGLKPEASEIRIFVAGAPVADAADINEKREVLSILMKELGGRFEIKPAHNTEHSIALFIPRSLAGGRGRITP